MYQMVKYAIMNIKINCQQGLGLVWDSLPPPTRSLELGQFFGMETFLVFWHSSLAIEVSLILIRLLMT